MTRIGFEHSRIFLPGVNNGLVRRFLLQCFEMFGKVKGIHEGKYMRFQVLQIRVMKGLDSGFFGSAVHALGLPIFPRVIRFGQLVSNAVFIANTAKDVHFQKKRE